MELDALRDKEVSVAGSSFVSEERVGATRAPFGPC